MSVVWDRWQASGRSGAPGAVALAHKDGDWHVLEPVAALAVSLGRHRVLVARGLCVCVSSDFQDCVQDHTYHLEIVDFWPM